MPDGKVFTLAEINRRKFELNGKVVRVELVGRRYDVEEMCLVLLCFGLTGKVDGYRTIRC